MFSGALVAIAAYLLGSIDFAVVISRARGTDIYQMGSGNPGASNVLRTVGKGPAALVLAGDAAKGAIAAGLGLAVGDLALAAAAGFFAVLGHCYPVFHKFRGGKGMATMAGAFLVTFTLPALILLVVWVALVALTRVASIGSLTVTLAAVPLLALFGTPTNALTWGGATAALVIYRHKGNISRLIKRAEATLGSNDR